MTAKVAVTLGDLRCHTYRQEVSRTSALVDAAGVSLYEIVGDGGFGQHQIVRLTHDEMEKLLAEYMDWMASDTRVSE